MLAGRQADGEGMALRGLGLRDVGLNCRRFMAAPFGTVLDHGIQNSSSLRMQAVNATFAGLPAKRNFW
jgi:hypothetical protein